MIQAPINVYPNGDTIYIDKTKEEGEYVNAPKFTFHFNGGSLSFLRRELYNARTGLIVGYAYAPKGCIPWTNYKNGDTVTINELVVADTCENGKNYQYRYILYQWNENEKPQCDMKIASGRVQADSSGSTITVESWLDTIENPYIVEDASGTSYNIGQCKIVFSAKDSSGNYSIENDIIVKDYNRSTGVITLASAMSGTIEKDMRYEIYSNYLKTPLYFFKARVEPTIVPVVQKNKQFNTIENYCQWRSLTSSGVNLSNYKWSLYGSVGTNGSLIDESPTIYSLHRKYTLPNHDYDQVYFDMNYDFPYLACKQVTVALNLETEDGYKMEKTELVPATTKLVDNLGDIYSNVNTARYTNCFYIDQTNKCISVRVFKKSGTKSVERFSLYRLKKGDRLPRLVDSMVVSGISTGYYPSFNDYLVSNGEEYTYYITQQYSDDTETTTSYAYKIGTVTPIWCNYTLQALSFYNTTLFDSSVYSVDKTWNLYFNFTMPSNTYNERLTVHEGGNGMPQISKMKGCYRSGSLDGAITQIKAYGSGKDKFDNSVAISVDWNDMLDNHDLFLLKTPYDETMIISISNSRELTHNEGTKFTIAKFEYVEMYKDTDIFIKG